MLRIVVITPTPVIIIIIEHTTPFLKTDIHPNLLACKDSEFFAKR